MRSPSLRVGLVGYGLAGSVFHAPLVAATDGLELAAVVTRAPERQAQVRREHPDAVVLDDVDALWARADDLDVVVIATPNTAHVPLGLAAVEHGLPVVVDKPLALDADGARRLVDAARDAGTVLTVFHNRRWDGDFLTVRRLVESGALGAVARFESRFERWRPAPRAGSWREIEPPEAGGGLLLDLGSHLVDQALVLFGRPTAVVAEVERRRPDVQGDDDVFVALTQDGGVRSHLWASAVAAQLGPRLRLLGDRAAYTKSGLDPQEGALRAGGRPSEPEWGTEPPERWGLLGIDGDVHPVPTEAGAYQAFYRGVVAAVRDGAPPPVDPADALAVMEVLDAAREAARTGEVVRLAADAG